MKLPCVLAYDVYATTIGCEVKIGSTFNCNLRMIASMTNQIKWKIRRFHIMHFIAGDGVTEKLPLQSPEILHYIILKYLFYFTMSYN